jgi:hypothetical protein
LPIKDYGGFFAEGTDPSLRRSELVRIASFGAEFDDVIFYGHPEDADTLPDLGYEAELRRGGLFLGHFVGCSARLRVTGATGEVGILMGWLPSDRIVSRAKASGKALDDYVFPRVSCRGIWIRVLSGDGQCEGANATSDFELSTGVGRDARADCKLVPATP